MENTSTFKTAAFQFYRGVCTECALLAEDRFWKDQRHLSCMHEGDHTCGLVHCPPVVSYAEVVDKGQGGKTGGVQLVGWMRPLWQPEDSKLLAWSVQRNVKQDVYSFLLFDITFIRVCFSEVKWLAFAHNLFSKRNFWKEKPVWKWYHTQKETVVLSLSAAAYKRDRYDWRGGQNTPVTLQLPPPHVRCGLHGSCLECWYQLK